MQIFNFCIFAFSKNKITLAMTDIKDYRVPHNKSIRLSDYDTYDTGTFKKKADAELFLAETIQELRVLQDVLYAHNRYAILLVFQAMDAAGKDGAIKHVMSGVNPQGCQVFSFKQPSSEELEHDYLWRCYKALPERGRIGIFNRSYYEEVLVTRVHPEYILKQRLPSVYSVADINEDFWKNRFTQINNFENKLSDSGTVIIKFFLNVSKDEQKRRFLRRIDRSDKNWKFSSADVSERKRWDDYMKYYEDTFNHTSSKVAPWYIVPADKKWYSQALIAKIIVETMGKLNLHYPIVSDAKRQELLKIRQELVSEK